MRDFCCIEVCEAYLCGGWRLAHYERLCFLCEKIHLQRSHGIPKRLSRCSHLPCSIGCQCRHLFCGETWTLRREEPELHPLFLRRDAVPEPLLQLSVSVREHDPEEPGSAGSGGALGEPDRRAHHRRHHHQAAQRQRGRGGRQGGGGHERLLGEHGQLGGGAPGLAQGDGASQGQGPAAPRQRHADVGELRVDRREHLHGRPSHHRQHEGWCARHHQRRDREGRAADEQRLVIDQRPLRRLDFLFSTFQLKSNG